MNPLIFLGSAAFLLSLCVSLAIRFLPSKHPAGGISWVGGGAVACAYLAAFGLLVGTSLRSGFGSWAPAPIALRLLVAASLAAFVGLLCDTGKIEPWHKGAGEIAVSCLAFWAGIRMEEIGGFHLGAWSLPLTIAWIMVCTGAIRWIAEAAGSAAGIGWLTSLTMVFAGRIEYNPSLVLVAIGLTGSVSGLLAARFPVSKIRLGETGNLFLGVLLGSGGILWSEKTTTIAGAIAPLLMLSLPLVDTASMAVRRFLVRQPSLEEANTRFIYFRPPRRGLSERGWQLASYLTCTTGAIASLLILSNRGPRTPVMAFCIALSIYIVRPNYREVAVAWWMFRQGLFHRTLASRIDLQPIEARLAEAATPAEWWNAVKKGLDDFGFERAQLSLAGLVFEWRRDVQASEVWEVELPMGGPDFVRLSRSFDASDGGDSFALFTSLLRSSLSTKRSMFHAQNNSEPRHSADAR